MMSGNKFRKQLSDLTNSKTKKIKEKKGDEKQSQNFCKLKIC